MPGASRSAAHSVISLTFQLATSSAASVNPTCRREYADQATRPVFNLERAKESTAQE
jgi:hypothetical protein